MKEALLVLANQTFNPYPRSRKAVYAKNGMVATGSVTASQAGLAILRQGGNAIDAAVATAATLTVVEPTSNGLGADAFAIIHRAGDNQLYGLNSSGPAPRGLAAESLTSRGLTSMPTFGWTPVDIPGAPAAWAALVQRFGKLSLAEDLAPAIAYAKQGYAISQVLGFYWQRAALSYRRAAAKDPAFAKLFAEWERVFAPGGHTPATGDIWRSPDHAATLQAIADSNAEAMYRGALAKRIAEFSEATGGYLRADDLAAFQPEWVTPLSVRYHGYDVFELPPNGQGIAALEALGILDGFEFAGRDNFNTTHRQIEAIKLGFADLFAHVGDPAAMTLDPAALLSPQYLASQRARIGASAMTPAPSDPNTAGTVYLCAADGDGNMISYIQSNYMGFGSGIVVPGTGIALNNRGNNFSLTPSSPNYLQGGKRPLNTIIPGFLTKDGQPVGPFGVMGGFMQPQGHVQVLMNAIDFGLDPQGALDAPRWQWYADKHVDFEPEFSTSLLAQLRAAGHDVTVNPEPNTFGRGQIIWRNPATGTLVGGSESRTDGAIAAW